MEPEKKNLQNIPQNTPPQPAQSEPKKTLQDAVQSMTTPPKPPETPKPNPDQPSQPAPPNTKTGMFKSLRTYQGDVDEILKKGQTSVSSIMVAEQKRKEKILEEPKLERHAQIKNTSFFWLGILLFLLGGAVVLGVLYYIGSQNTVTLIEKAPTVIGYSEEKDIVAVGLSRDALVSKISVATTSFSAPVNSILFLNMIDASNTPIAASDLLASLAPNMPGSLSRALGSPYMIGVYSSGSNVPFIILTTQDYATTYAGMLKWEPSMVSDLGQIFAVPQESTTTPYVFTDEALQNKDLRVVKGADGKTVLLYSFIDRNTLVVTANENVLTAIIGKYLISKTTQ